ncbi:MAG: SDR family oxidoreductase [Candidatus Geothermincolia bacterium]
MRQLYGKNALVTGGAMGMGKSLAELLLREGSRVAIVDIRDSELEAAREELSALGEVATFKCDISDRPAVYALADKVREEFGSVDLLVNNAGIVKAHVLMEKPDELIEKNIGVNLLAHFWTMKAFLPDMMERRTGHIVNMASAGGILGVPYISDYCATKFGVIGLTESIRQELKLQGFKKIKISYVCPNTVGTGMFAGNKPVKGTKMLEPEDVTTKIIIGIKRGKERIYIPSSVYTAALLKSILPVPVMDFTSRLMGIATSSQTMTGRDVIAK